MRKALIGGALLVALMSTAPASAGCWATVGLAPPPSGTSAGDLWKANITVLQHGRNPLPDARDASPKVTIFNRASGESQTFVARASDPTAGRYVARVVFPSAGRWSYEVFDGFTSWNGDPAPCAQTHTFASVQIGGRPGAATGGGSGDASAANVTASSGGAAATDRGALPLWALLGGLGAILVGAIAGTFFLRRHATRTQAAA
jgi:hypothetical protein